MYDIKNNSEAAVDIWEYIALLDKRKLYEK
jgi:hypothetical protein